MDVMNSETSRVPNQRAISAETPEAGIPVE